MRRKLGSAKQMGGQKGPVKGPMGGPAGVVAENLPVQPRGAKAARSSIAGAKKRMGY